MPWVFSVRAVSLLPAETAGEKWQFYLQWDNTEVIRRPDMERNGQTDGIKVLHKAKPLVLVQFWEIIHYSQFSFYYTLYFVSDRRDPLDIDHLRDGFATWRHLFLMLHNYTVNFTVSVRQLNDEWVRNKETTRWKMGWKEGFRHCTSTDGKKKRWAKRREIERGGWGGQRLIAQSEQGRHNPSLE